MAQISVRLDEKVSKGLEKAAAKLHIRRSDVVRVALVEFLKKGGLLEESEDESFYDKLSPFIGVIDSGIHDLSTNRKHLDRRMKKPRKL